MLAYRRDAGPCATHTAIARWKYDGDLVVGSALARCFAQWGRTLPGDFDVVVPVPVHRARLVARGFNQAAVLAIALGAARALPTFHALTRGRSDSSQTTLGRAQRRANVAGRFVARRPSALAARRVLLVDDVITSGATADECSRVLLEAGATSVEVWALARAGSDGHSSS
jgi:ComF family protein